MSRFSRFSLFTLLALATSVAIFFGVLVHWAKSNQIAVQALKDSGATLRGSYTSDGGPWLLRKVFPNYEEYDARMVSFQSNTTMVYPDDTAALAEAPANAPSLLEVNDDDISRLVPHLNAFKNLETLAFSDQPMMTGRSLGRFAKSRAAEGISQLDFHGTGLCDDGVSHLSQFSKLWVLRISSSPITDNCVEDLAKIRTLDNLEVVDTLMSEEGLAKLKQLLPRCRVNHVSDAVRKLSIHCVQKYGGDVSQNEDGFMFIQLHSHKVPITNARLRETLGCRRLRQLIARNSQITGDGLQVLGAFRHLRILDLSGSKEITDAAIPQLAGLSKLEELTVTGTGMSADGVRQLRQTLPDCKANY